MKYAVLTACVLTSSVCVAQGQTLLSQAPPPQPVAARDEEPMNPDLAALSLTVVESPKPKTFEVHDLITIVIAESSKSSSSQKLDTKKDTNFKATLAQFPALMKFLEAELTNGQTTSVGVDLSSGQKVKGDGKYERDDRFADRITAEVIDVKPNGRLTLEARRMIQKDEELQTLVLQGECRREDVTNANTVLSTQLAGLTLRAQNEGHVKDAADKGWITRVFEAVFNF